VQQYSATVWQRAIAEDRKVLAFAPQLEFASFVLGDFCVGLGRFGFFNFVQFGSVFNLKYLVSIFSVSVFAPHHDARVSWCVKILRRSQYTSMEVFVKVHWPTTLSVKEFFFTLGVINSFTLGVVGLSVNLSQLGRI